jgi:hypothetical protein
MAKQTFTAGQVLTAAQVNALQSDIFNQTVSTKVANYTFVVGDRGTRVVGNGTSITFTVDNSIFSAGDTIKLHNINSTALTIAAGAGVTINAAAGLTMVQWQEATLFATSASSFILFESTASSAQGLTLINTTSFSAVSSVSLPASTFSATYKSYRIVMRASISTAGHMQIRLRTAGTDNTTSNYYSGYWYTNLATGATGTDAAGAASNIMSKMGYSNGANVINVFYDVYNPFESTVTGFSALQQRVDAVVASIGGFFQLTTSFDSATFIPSAGTITGNVSVYGYNE